MRQARLKAPSDRPAGFYHCISRVVDRQFVLGDAEKEHFVALLHEYEAFCGVCVLTYCVLSNHFHILVEVPRRPEKLPSSEELLAKLKSLSGGAIGAATFAQRIEMYRQAQDPTGEKAFCELFFARMWDVSAFMKLLKQRFTQWFNGRHDRKGTLWEERFRSVLVDSAGEALATMAAYIDLNPVRAGLVSDPEDYRWCGYAEAMAGKRRARQALQTLATGLTGQAETLTEAMRRYRAWLFGQGEEKEGTTEDGRPLRRGLDREEVLAVIATNGRVGLAEYLRCRVRYFVDGAVFGSREFVESIFRAQRGRFGAKRRDGARRMRGVAGEYFTLRSLRVQVFG